MSQFYQVYVEHDFKPSHLIQISLRISKILVTLNIGFYHEDRVTIKMESCDGDSGTRFLVRTKMKGKKLNVSKLNAIFGFWSNVMILNWK